MGDGRCRQSQRVTAVHEKVRRSTCNAKVLGSIPEALQKGHGGSYGSCCRGAAPRVELIEAVDMGR
eukprot:2079441-Prymnesium_polylepis.1